MEKVRSYCGTQKKDKKVFGEPIYGCLSAVLLG